MICINHRVVWKKHTLTFSTDKSLIFGQIGLDQQCNPRSDCSLNTGLIMVYTVADSVAHFYWGIIAGQGTAVLAAGAGKKLLPFLFPLS